MFIYIYDMPRKLVLSKENLVLTDEIEGSIQKKVTPFGTGAKVDCPKKYLGRPPERDFQLGWLPSTNQWHPYFGIIGKWIKKARAGRFTN